jgi:hypothetical protein
MQAHRIWLPVHSVSKLFVRGLVLAGLASALSAAQAQSRPTLASLQAAVDCLNLGTERLEIRAASRGAYDAAGVRLAGDSGVTGRVVVGGTVFGPFRTYYVFLIRHQAQPPE